MSDWTGGYVTDIAYTHGYYPELNPQRLKLAFLNAGYAFPETGTACELGFGQGISTNVHAAASVTHWYGTDFNPSQAAFAQDLAVASGARTQLFDQAFDEFCSRSDLPDFDFIGLHGIFSWINDDNRRIIVDFLRRKLKVGGVLYISYNTQPGWAAAAPLRDLMSDYAELMCAPGTDVVKRIDASIEFAQKVLGTDAAYARVNPGIEKRLELIKTQPRNYVAHEYFNSNWLPISFSNMSRWLTDAKLSFVTSANFLEQVDVITLSNAQLELLASVSDPVYRQTVRDFLLNTQFRRDYWVRGARPLRIVEQAELLRAQRVVLVTPRADVSLKVASPLGEANLLPAVNDPLLDYLADHQPRSIGEIEQAITRHGVSLAQLVQALVILIGKGAIYPAQDGATVEAVTPRVHALNRALCKRARDQAGIEALASPLTGGGIQVSRFEQIYLHALELGMSQPDEWARLILGLLKQQGQGMLKDGKPVEEQDQMRELLAQATQFKEQRLPLLRILRVCS